MYSSPGPWTCGGCTGSWGHEEQDAQTYAKWGFDYLKYDWCTYGDIADGRDPVAKDIPRWNGNFSDPAGAIYPYKVMGNFLREQKRDIVFSLCQYGMADVEKWGGSVNGNSWRTTDDITDKWGEARHGWQSGGGGAGGGVATIGFNQDKVAPFAKPGNWNDPDMLVVGKLGWGRLHPTRLAPDEQYSHISLWCLLSAPLLIGCDLTQLDPFTLNLLENDEVLAVDQDALGHEAMTVAKIGDTRVYAKDLEDGSKAVGLFNLGDTPATVVADWQSVKLAGPQTIRDLWRQKDLGVFEKEFSATVAPHGVVLVKIQPAPARWPCAASASTTTYCWEREEHPNSPDRYLASTLARRSGGPPNRPEHRRVGPAQPSASATTATESGPASRARDPALARCPRSSPVSRSNCR